MDIKKVVIIGSGTMGSGIAAHLCNANVPVTLLDLKTEISEKARDRIYKSRPPLLIDKSKIENIKVGNINDNFDVVKEADWIVEAVVERIDIKHNIYEKIFKNRKDGAIVSSNTSSIPIKVLSEKLTNEEKKDFYITHFFNIVRYMGVLEIVDPYLLNHSRAGESFLYRLWIDPKQTPIYKIPVNLDYLKKIPIEEYPKRWTLSSLIQEKTHRIFLLPSYPPTSKELSFYLFPIPQ